MINDILPPDTPEFELLAKALQFYADNWQPLSRNDRAFLEDSAEAYIKISEELNHGPVKRMFNEAFEGEQ